MNIKPSNYNLLHDDFLLNQNRLTGSKLQALNRLIESKGTVLNTEQGTKKALEISEGFFISLTITHYSKGSFFPCKVQKTSYKLLN